MEPTISRSIELATGVDVVWATVTDLTRMGELSPENVGGYWIRGTGPAVGARFRGTNRNGRRKWSTYVRVVEFVPRRRFTFDVRAQIGMRVSRWSYELAPAGTGCVLTEHWYRVGNQFVQRFLGPRVTGRADRPGFNAYSIEHTLTAIKALLDGPVISGAEPRTPAGGQAPLDPPEDICQKAAASAEIPARTNPAGIEP